MLATACSTEFLWALFFFVLVFFMQGTEVPRTSMIDCRASDSQRPGSHLLYDQSDVSFFSLRTGTIRSRNTPER